MEEFLQFIEGTLELIGEHQGAIMALATAVIAVTAVVTSKLTSNLARENTLLRKAGTEPEVAAYLNTDPRYRTMVNFVLANIGQGPACNVRFHFRCDEEDFASHDVELRNTDDRKAMSVLPQGECFTAHFGVGHSLFREPRLKPFHVEVRYEDVKGHPREGLYTLDISQFEGVTFLGKPADHEIAESLKKIKAQLEGVLVNGRPIRVNTMTVAEARAEAEQLRERHRAQRQHGQSPQSGNANSSE